MYYPPHSLTRSLTLLVLIMLRASTALRYSPLPLPPSLTHSPLLARVKKHFSTTPNSLPHSRTHSHTHSPLHSIKHFSTTPNPLPHSLTHSPPVRVRFAPSPTGSLHIGGARTALFNYLFTRKHNGKFIVRVEDTDESRSTRVSERSILKDIQWLGLHIDEGPDEYGGEYGPYRQSERKHIYQAYATQLLTSGHAYRCFCTNNELQKKKEAREAVGKPNTYDGEWRDRDPVEVEKLLAQGVPHTIRFRVPNKNFSINDMVRGRVVWNPAHALGDFIIMRSSGMPVYNFCVAIDDYLMKISHVIRAEEHLSNTIKQLLIFDALNATPPEYAHCSLILGSDKSKLSKRHGAASLSEFASKGYFPAAMRNYLAMLGWNSGTNKEIFNDQELVEAFDAKRIVKSPAVFDTTRLNWINSQHIALLPHSEFIERCEEVMRNCSGLPLLPSRNATVSEEVKALEEEFVCSASTLSRSSLKFIDDVIPLTQKILRYPFNESRVEKRGVKTLASDVFTTLAHKFVEDFKAGIFPRPVVGQNTTVADNVVQYAQYNPEEFSEYLNKTADTLNIPRKQAFFPSRLALTGALSGPDIGSQLRLLELTHVILERKKLSSDGSGDGSSDCSSDGSSDDSSDSSEGVEFVSLDQRMAELEAYLKSKVE
jgi:glutamyl-tRNA synthetase